MTLSEVIKPKSDSSALKFDSLYSVNFLTQFWLVLKRIFQNYWRATEFNLTRFSFMLFLGILFGLVYLYLFHYLSCYS